MPAKDNDFDVLSASKDALLAKGKDMGLNVNDRMSAATLRQKVGEHHGLHIKEKALDRSSQKQFEISVYAKPGVRADRPIPVAVQGVQFLIKPGVKVTVPAMVVEALENAVETQYEAIVDENDPNKVVLLEKDAPSYPYQVHREVSAA